MHAVKPIHGETQRESLCKVVHEYVCVMSCKMEGGREAGMIKGACASARVYIIDCKRECQHVWDVRKGLFEGSTFHRLTKEIVRTPDIILFSCDAEEGRIRPQLCPLAACSTNVAFKPFKDSSLSECINQNLIDPLKGGHRKGTPIVLSTELGSSNRV
jgi:hypothetical protein